MTRWVRVEWPAVLKMTADELAEVAGFEVRVVDGGREIRTREHAEGVAPRLLRMQYVARRGAPEHELRFLREWHGNESGRVDPAVTAELDRLLGGDPQLHQFLYANQLLFLCAPDEDLPAIVRGNLIGSLDDALPDHRVAFIAYDTKVHARTAFIRSLLAAQHAPDWLNWSEERGFGALSTFAGGVLMGDTTVVDPLLAVAFPWMFGMSLTRVGAGLAVVLFGKVLPWHPGLRDVDLGEMLLTSHLVEQPVVRVPKTPEIDVDDAVTSVRWWVSQADALLGIFTDPTLFADSGVYDVRSHAAAAANVERLFASVLAALGHTGRDEYSRQLHLFEALDILEGFGLGGYDQTLSYARCTEIVDDLAATLPASAGRLLLPRCRDAVEGLRAVQDGFIEERRADNGVRLLTSSGAEQVVTYDSAASQLLRQIRNGGHGLRRALSDLHHLSVLTSHDGDIPSNVSDIGFLHLVRLLAKPELLEERFERRSGTARPPG